MGQKESHAAETAQTEPCNTFDTISGNTKGDIEAHVAKLNIHKEVRTF